MNSLGSLLCSVTYSNRLLELQKRAARIVFRADIMTPSEIMFRELNWLPFYKRVQYHIYIFMYETLKHLALDYVLERFITIFEKHGRNLRSRAKWFTESPIPQNGTMTIPFQ